MQVSLWVLFYRRFKNKESLLPLLYQDFGNDLAHWVTEVELMKFANLKEAIEIISIETYQSLQHVKVSLERCI